jgi:DNA replication licensing factor MCM4
MLDKANEAYDTRLAHHILSIYTKKKDNYGMAHPPYNKTELTNYITFARQEYFPQLTEEACNRLSQAYVEMRNINSDRKTVTATPRQLESMIRLSEAFAKMSFPTEVQVIDVENSISLIKSALQQQQLTHEPV